MFDLAAFFREYLYRISFKDMSGAKIPDNFIKYAYTVADFVAEDIQKSGVSITPEIIKEFHNKEAVNLEDGTNISYHEGWDLRLQEFDYIKDNIRIMVWNEGPTVYSHKEVNVSFSLITLDGGIIRGKYNQGQNTIDVVYYNSESVEFAKSLNLESSDDLSEAFRETLVILGGEDNGIKPDGRISYNIEKTTTFTDIINDLLERFKEPKQNL